MIPLLFYRKFLVGGGVSERREGERRSPSEKMLNYIVEKPRFPLWKNDTQFPVSSSTIDGEQPTMLLFTHHAIPCPERLSGYQAHSRRSFSYCVFQLPALLSAG